MRLIEVEIDRFEGMTEQVFLFGKGTNRRASLQTDKDTLFAFLHFALYGVPAKKDSPAAGRVLLEDAGVQYRITRSYTPTSRTEECAIPASEALSVTRLPAGEVVSLGSCSVGEYFLGLGEALFEAVFLPHSTLSSTPSGDATHLKLLHTAAERELLSLTGENGLLAALEQQSDALTAALTKARAERARLTELKLEADRHLAAAATVRARVEELQRGLRRAQLQADLSDFEELKKCQDTIVACQKELSSLVAHYGGAAVYDEELSTRVGALLEAKQTNEIYIRTLTAELERLRATVHDQAAVEIAERLHAEGGAKRVMAQHHKLLRLLCIFGVLFAAFGITAAVFFPLFTAKGGTLWLILGIVTAALAGSSCGALCRYSIAFLARLHRLGLNKKQLTLLFLEDCEHRAEVFYTHRAESAVLTHDLKKAAARDEELLHILQKEFEDACGAPFDSLEEGERILQILTARQQEARAASAVARTGLEQATQKSKLLTDKLGSKQKASLSSELSELADAAYTEGDAERLQALLQDLQMLDAEAEKALQQVNDLARAAQNVDALAAESRCVSAALKRARRRHRAVLTLSKNAHAAERAYKDDKLPTLTGKADAFFAATEPTADVAHLCLRMALLSEVKETPLPLILPELPQKTAERLVEVFALQNRNRDVQVLIYT